MPVIQQRLTELEEAYINAVQQASAFEQVSCNHNMLTDALNVAFGNAQRADDDLILLTAIARDIALVNDMRANALETITASARQVYNAAVQRIYIIEQVTNASQGVYNAAFAEIAANARQACVAANLITAAQEIVMADRIRMISLQDNIASTEQVLAARSEQADQFQAIIAVSSIVYGSSFRAAGDAASQFKIAQEVFSAAQAEEVSAVNVNPNIFIEPARNDSSMMVSRVDNPHLDIDDSSVIGCWPEPDLNI